MIQNIMKDKVIFMILFSFILIALVASDIIVLDEEALVAGCFVLFVLFAYKNVGEVIASELEDRAAKIQKELQKSFDHKKELLLLQVENSKKQMLLLEDVEVLYNYSLFQINNIIEKRRKSILSQIAHQTNQQLRSVSIKEKDIVDSLQREAVASFSNSVLQEFKSNTPDAIEARSRLLQEGINQLKQASI